MHTSQGRPHSKICVVNTISTLEDSMIQFSDFKGSNLFSAEIQFLDMVCGIAGVWFVLLIMNASILGCDCEQQLWLSSKTIQQPTAQKLFWQPGVY